MTSETRIPKAEITGLYGVMLKRFSKKLLGDVAEPAEVMWHHRQVLKDVMAFGPKGAQVERVRSEPEVVRAHGGRVAGRLQLVPRLRLLPGPQREARRDEGQPGASLARIRRVHAAGARRHGVRRGDEPDPPTVTDELSARLLTALGAPTMVELTAWIAYANQVTRTNTAFGIESQGFSSACEIPLAKPSRDVASTV